MKWLLAGLLVVACGSPGTRPPAPVDQPSAATRDELVVSAQEATLVLDATSGTTLRTLPAGTLSPARDAIVAVTPGGAMCGDPRDMQACTLVQAYDLLGRLLEEWFLTGRYTLPAQYGPAASGFSPNGKWLVLVSRDAVLSRFAILDLTRLGQRSALAGPGLAAPAAKGSHTIVALSARFSFDAIHDDGGALYLIEHPVEGATAYNVRLYEVRAQRLRPEPIFDKAVITRFDPTTGLMDGAFHASVAPVGGQWQYGLYVKRDGSLFVHALNLAQRFATCIVDLPGRRAASSMLSLALSRDAGRLFVVDPGAGSAAEIDAASQKVRRAASFAGRGGTGDPARAAAVVSPDGGRLYATGPRGVAVLATADLALRGWVAAGAEVRALALSTDGGRLYAFAGGAVEVLEAPSGRSLATFAVPASVRALAVAAAVR
ncbi:MAG TPA: hypothetical protein VFM93_02650 [Candidatus Limnocylindria bacterium]|nr:hypothetical protein [Candidatus Limnocylindria bacterium]